MVHITKEQRYEIKAYLKCGKSKEFIAKELGFNKSTIFRELKRNSTKTGKYNPKFADELYNERKERFKRKRKFTTKIKETIDYHLTKEQWSPEQILGYCKSHDLPMVSIERIYQYIREDKLKGGDLYKNTRHRLKHRRRPVGENKIPIKNRVSIEQRPEIVNLKERFGDWEMDTIVGPNNKGAILTITEKTTNFFLMKKLENGKNAKDLAKTLVKLLLPYKDYVHTITTDNGTEFAEHEYISKKLNTNIYFAHPYCSWEKGLIEYTNKLIRQYIPKKTDINTINNDFVMEVQRKINRRPRKKLKYKSPTEIFYNFVA